MTVNLGCSSDLSTVLVLVFRTCAIKHVNTDHSIFQPFFASQSNFEPQAEAVALTGSGCTALSRSPIVNHCETSTVPLSFSLTCNYRLWLNIFSSVQVKTQLFLVVACIFAVVPSIQVSKLIPV